MELERKVVRATYTCEEEFKVPIGIDLEDREQVEYWSVKYNVLRIKMKIGKIIEVKAFRDQPQNYDWKYVDKVDIRDDEDYEEDNKMQPRMICFECANDIRPFEINKFKLKHKEILLCNGCYHEVAGICKEEVCIAECVLNRLG